MHASACCCCFRIGSRNDKVRVAWKRVYQTLIVFTVLFLSRSMRDRLGANRRSSACHSAHTLGPPGHEWPSTNDGVPREQSPIAILLITEQTRLFRRRDLLQC